MRGRIRTIKPEAFLDEGLFDLEQETGLPVRWAFAGLWTQADREGRFEWRPRALKAAILPYDNVDFSRVLHALATRGFLVRYASEGREYGLVRNFTRHQAVNNRESASTLPAPPENPEPSPPSTRPPRVDDASSTRQVHALEERKGTEGNGREHPRPSVVQGSEGRARAHEAPPDERTGLDLVESRRGAAEPALKRAWSECWLKRAGRPASASMLAEVGRCAGDIAAFNARCPERDAAELATLAVQRFFEANTKYREPQVAWFARDPAKYLDDLEREQRDREARSRRRRAAFEHQQAEARSRRARNLDRQAHGSDYREDGDTPDDEPTHISAAFGHELLAQLRKESA